MPPTIREATEADLPRIVELLVQLAPDEDREDTHDPLPYYYHLSFRQHVEQGHRVLVAVVRKKIVGTATLYVMPNLSHKGTPFGSLRTWSSMRRRAGRRTARR